MRLRKVAALLAARLDNPPSLNEMAAAAAVSPYHFHRIWRALTGETVGETVSRLRIEASQAVLAGGGSNVTDAAMAAGFATPQSFARAFRRRTGTTPSAYRDAAPAGPPAAAPGGGVIDIVLRDPTTVVALRREGRAYVDLNATFGAVWAWAQQAGLLEGMTGIYGLPLDDPESVPAERLRYDAGFALGETARPPAPFSLLALAGGEHARLIHRGAYAGLEAATQHLVGTWLPLSGREPADAPLVHQFLNDPDETPERELVTHILLPLRPARRR